MNPFPVAEVAIIRFPEMMPDSVIRMNEGIGFDRIVIPERALRTLPVQRAEFRDLLGPFLDNLDQGSNSPVRAGRIQAGFGEQVAPDKEREAELEGRSVK
jgi:hypothetical protein